VVGWDTGGSAKNTVINTWVVGGPATTLRAFGAANAVSGGTASIGISWNVVPGARYLGVVEVSNPPNTAILGTTQIFVDTVPAAPAPTGVPIIIEAGLKEAR
jgi:hypothetical protein